MLKAMAEKHIVLVEDDDTIRENYKTLFEARGFYVHDYPSKESFYECYNKVPTDIYIFDITLGRDFDAGFEICQHVRSNDIITPIIFLTARDTDIDKISGVRLGADDYLSKTTSTEYIVARISTLLRRVEGLQSASNLTSTKTQGSPRSHLTINDELSTATWRGEALELSLTQFWIVQDLHRHLGQVRSIYELMDAANITVQANTIVAHIKTIRQAFLRIDPDFSCIKSERARGYRWAET